MPSVSWVDSFRTYCFRKPLKVNGLISMLLMNMLENTQCRNTSANCIIQLSNFPNHARLLLNHLPVSFAARDTIFDHTYKLITSAALLWRQTTGYSKVHLRRIEYLYVQPPGLVPRTCRGKLIVWFLNRRQELPPVQAVCSPTHCAASRCCTPSPNGKAGPLPQK